VTGTAPEGLHHFIVRAKAATYAAGGGLVPETAGGEHEHAFADGPWRYRDRYVGGTDFCGQEVVWHEGTPVWAMVYAAALLRPDLLDAGQAGQVIKTALSELYARGRFLGGWSMSTGGWDYLDLNEGDPDRFSGLEQISREGLVCYRLRYAGGLVRE